MNMCMRKLFVGLLLFGVALVLSGCGGGRSLVGKWDAQIAQVQSAVMEFRADGTTLMTGTVQGGFGIEMIGTYKVAGEEITSSIKEAKLTGQVNDMIKQMFDGQAKEFIGKETKAKLIWNSDDEVVIEPLNTDPKNPISAASLSLKRKKA